MKKIILSLTIALVQVVGANAQVNPNAIGVRSGGGNYGFGGEISYQKGLGNANRLELDLGWGSYNAGFGYRAGYTAVTGIYHWVFVLDDGLNWYVGPGGQLLLFSNNYIGSSSIAAGFGGQIGIEYDFNKHDFPLLLSLDTRPMFLFSNGGSGVGWGGALSVRYTF